MEIETPFGTIKGGKNLAMIMAVPSIVGALYGGFVFYKDYIDLYDDVGAKTTINATVFPSGLSHHVVTYGGGTIKWYINGTLDTTTTYTISNNLDNPELQIGEPNTPGNSDQYNRVFRVYTTDLNSTQVTQNYNAATS